MIISNGFVGLLTVLKDCPNLENIDLEIWLFKIAYIFIILINRSIISEEIFSKICNVLKEFHYPKIIKMSFNRLQTIN